MDAVTVAERLRAEDRAEVLAAGGLDPRLLLPLYVREGRAVQAAGLQENGRAEILFGFDPIPGTPRAATAWMLSTDVIYEHPVTFVINSKRIWEEAHTRYDLLTNFIDARNTRHIQWLKWLGAKGIRRVEKFGAHSLPFIEFASYRPCA